MFAGRERIRTIYQRDDIAEDYIQSRYGREPFGRALHECQARLLRNVLAAPAKFEAKCVTSGTHRWAVLDAP